jgi:ribonuclease HI / DNA polymerase III subunit epsilon
MSQTITLYVDGACRGNPGLGGWGAYIITETEEHKLCGGEDNTTNNRMELTAAIEGILFCPTDAKLVVWTDSTYVKRGITEWITGWKKKRC